MGLALSPFAHRKQNNRALFLWDALDGNVAISNVYKWHHSDVIVIKLAADRIKFSKKRIFQNFHILKINRMVPFCKLFMEQPSYI